MIELTPKRSARRLKFLEGRACSARFFIRKNCNIPMLCEDNHRNNIGNAIDWHHLLSIRSACSAGSRKMSNLIRKCDDCHIKRAL